MAQGDSWQLAVAVPLKNNHFEYGQNYVTLLNEGISPNAQYIKVSRDFESARDILQFRDQILIGPSSNSSDKGETEHMSVSGMYLDYTNSPKIYLLNKDNTYNYEVGDRVSFYGTGCAGGWDILGDQQYIKAEGIQKGAISRHIWTGFSQDLYSNGQAAGTYRYFHNGGNPYILFRLAENDGDFSFLLDLNETYGNRIQYLMDPVYTDDNKKWSRFAMSVGSSGQAISALYGDYHIGGYRKSYAQRIAIVMSGSTPTGQFFRQELTRSGTESLRDRALLIPYQYYRVGGRVYFDTSFTSQTFRDTYNIYLGLKASQNTRDIGDTEHVNLEVTSTGNSDKWYNFSTVGLLDSGIHKSSSPCLSFWFQNNGIASYKGELIMYVDELWAEHAGGVNYANIDGCLDFGRYSVWPDEDSLKIDKVPREGTTSLYGRKDRWVISCRLNYVSQTFWDQFEIIREWQEKGFLLNLHTYINDIPYTLTGRVEVKEYAKDNWDLDLRSFTMEFIEE